MVMAETLTSKPEDCVLILILIWNKCSFPSHLLYLLMMQKLEVPPDYDKHDPEQKQIYRFVRTLFSAAQLTAECAIVTLVSV